MRLLSISISDYKNLKNFTLNFESKSLIDVFVGKNGAGKSNFFEALIDIFRHLYEFDKYQISFEYSIKYEINGKETIIEWKNDKLYINGLERKTIGLTPLPDNVLIYYSGHNTKVSDLVQSYEESFKASIKDANIEDTRTFIGIGKEYKQLLLAIVLIQDEADITRHFICNKLGIKTIGSELKLTLGRPFYAKSIKFDIENNDESDRYWRPEGITKTFLNRLTKCKRDDSKGPVRTEGYLPNDDKYVLYFNIESIQKEFSDYTQQELFRQFDNLKTIEMLKDISTVVTLENGFEATTDHFSDGQFQSVYIYSIIELFKDKNCITLLDEPDSFLHPEWQFEFLNQVFEITDINTNNHILMSSHSASTITRAEESHLNLFEIKNSAIISSKVCKKDIINSLSKGFIKFTEDESILRINNAIRTSSKPVLFVEGPSDVLILEAAYKKLYYNEDLPILIQDAFDRGFIRVLMSRNELFTRYPNKFFFALFDFDEAYNDWREMQGVLEENTLCTGLCKKLYNKNAYVLLLPIPDNDLKNQVWDEHNEIEKIRSNPHFCIEHIFCGIAETNDYFREQIVNGAPRVVFKGDSYKVRFAEHIVPTLPLEAFEPFRPMFDFIKNKCTSIELE